MELTPAEEGELAAKEENRVRELRETVFEAQEDIYMDFDRSALIDIIMEQIERPKYEKMTEQELTEELERLDGE